MAGEPEPADQALAAAQAEIARLERVVAEQGRRARGTLAVIGSIVRRGSRPGGSVEDYAARLSGRLAALARSEARASSGTLAPVDLELMLADEMLAHAVRLGEQATLSGPGVALDGRAGELMALAAHELASNSVQFGALGDGGTVSVRWTGGKGAPLRIEWREMMTGAPPALGEAGFGLDLLTRMLAYELGAEAEVMMAPRGLAYTITLPSVA